MTAPETASEVPALLLNHIRRKKYKDPTLGMERTKHLDVPRARLLFRLHALPLPSLTHEPVADVD